VPIGRAGLEPARA